MRTKAVAAAVGLTLAETALLARRRGFLFGASTVVRCRRGHIFTTLWIPGASVKSLRFGWWRLQWCPVGRHWSVVVPLRASDLTTRERRLASRHRDRRVP